MVRSKLFQILLGIGLTYNDIAKMGDTLPSEKRGVFIHEIIKERSSISKSKEE